MKKGRRKKGKEARNRGRREGKSYLFSYFIFLFPFLCLSFPWSVSSPLIIMSVYFKFYFFLSLSFFHFLFFFLHSFHVISLYNFSSPSLPFLSFTPSSLSLLLLPPPAPSTHCSTCIIIIITHV